MRGTPPLVFADARQIQHEAIDADAIVQIKYNNLFDLILFRVLLNQFGFVKIR